MKKSLLALAVLGAFAGAASAQTNVTVYGTLDVGVSKANNATTNIGAGDNNKLGFKGTEDLGGGLSALFQAEIRFDPDTGTTEGNGTRPMFQGQTRVGLAGGFGMVRLGRGLTANQESFAAFDPWGSTRARGAMIPFAYGPYGSDPLNPGVAPQNRFTNALFYNTPVMSGFQANVTVATKETGALLTGAAGTPAYTPTRTPVSFSGTYNNGPIGAMVGYERNAIDAKVWNVGGTYVFGPAKLFVTYAKSSKSDVAGLPVGVFPGGLPLAGLDAKTWTLGTKVGLGVGSVLAAYGQSRPDDLAKVKRAALGYEYPLSKRTYLYTDAINMKTDGIDSVRTFDVGVHHNF